MTFQIMVLAQFAKCKLKIMSFMSLKKEILCIYVRTTVGHISLYREIEEAIQGFFRACSYGT